MDEELDRYVNEAADPRLIRGIYSYCHGRCERCPFTERCFTFRQMREDETRPPNHGVIERTEQNFAQAVDLLQSWCEREGIDFEKLREEARSESSIEEQTQLGDAIEQDPLQEIAERYMMAALDLVSSLDRLSPFHEWPFVVREALDTIGWYAGGIGAKVHRALHGLAERHDLGGDENAVQNDWNGSAKAARLAIAESQRAWDTLLAVGEAPPDARLRQTRHLLDEIDSRLAARFPQAMEFVRPGFDEPDVAAGAVSTLESYEPRRAQRPLRAVVEWLQRLAGAWPRRS
jgi:hypothetical protein